MVFRVKLNIIDWIETWRQEQDLDLQDYREKKCYKCVSSLPHHTYPDHELPGAKQLKKEVVSGQKIQIIKQSSCVEEAKENHMQIFATNIIPHEDLGLESQRSQTESF